MARRRRSRNPEPESNPGPEPDEGPTNDELSHSARFQAAMFAASSNLEQVLSWLRAAEETWKRKGERATLGEILMAEHSLTKTLDLLIGAELNILAIEAGQA